MDSITKRLGAIYCGGAIPGGFPCLLKKINMTNLYKFTHVKIRNPVNHRKHQKFSFQLNLRFYLFSLILSLPHNSELVG